MRLVTANQDGAEKRWKRDGRKMCPLWKERGEGGIASLRAKMPFLPMDFLYCFHKMFTASMADRLGCNIVAPISFLEETEESHDAGAPSLRMQCSCLYLIFKHRKEAAHNAIGRSLSMLPFTRSLSVTFVELSEGNGVGGNGKGKEREEREELVRSSRAFQGPFASVRSLARSLFPLGRNPK